MCETMLKRVLVTGEWRVEESAHGQTNATCSSSSQELGTTSVVEHEAGREQWGARLNGENDIVRQCLQHNIITHKGPATLSWFSFWGRGRLFPRGTECSPNLRFELVGVTASLGIGFTPDSGGVWFHATEQKTADSRSMTICPGTTASTMFPHTQIGPPGVDTGKFFQQLEPLFCRQLRSQGEKRKNMGERVNAQDNRFKSRAPGRGEKGGTEAGHRG